MSSNPFSAKSYGPFKSINNCAIETLLTTQEKKKSNPAERRRIQLKRAFLRNYRANRSSSRTAVMKRIPSIRQGPLTNFVDKDNYAAIKTVRKSVNNVELLFAQKKQSAARTMIPVSTGIAQKNNTCEWNLVPQRVAALKKVASVQMGPLTDFKPKTIQIIQKKINFAKKILSNKKKQTKPISAMFKSQNKALKKKNKLKEIILRKVVMLRSFKMRLSNPGIILVDDKLGNRLFIHDSLNMYRDSWEIFTRRSGTIGERFWPFVTPQFVRANIILSYIPSGAFEKIIKSSPPRYSSWTELGAYFWNIRP